MEILPGTDEHLYLRLAGKLQQQILQQTLKVGDKLPSVRTLSKECGVSVSTVLQAYYHLEAKGLVQVRPQSGYYVGFSPQHLPAMPDRSTPVQDNCCIKSVEQIIGEVYSHITEDAVMKFSLSVPTGEMLPIAKLNKAMIQAMRELPGSGTAYENIQGNIPLRKQIARWSVLWGGKLSEDDIVTTEGCMNAISYCLMALTQPGDTIAVESPVFFGILQLANTLKLNVLELPTDAQTGVDLDCLKKVLEKQQVKVCLFVSNFNNPLGSCMPDSHKKEVVRLLEYYHIPLIEDDLYGDIYFGDHRPASCKTYDESGLVLWCSSVSKTLAPGYRVGWVAPGKFKAQVRRLKHYQAVSTTTLTQQAIANFLDNNRYEHYLRKLRQNLHANSLKYIRAIGEYFPEGTCVSRPQGGFILWVELDRRINTFELYRKAMAHGISIAPGRMFTLRDQYHHCMRLSYGLVWNEKVDAALRKLGGLIKEML